MVRRVVAWFVGCSIIASGLATVRRVEAQPDEPAGEDEPLFRCKQRTGEVLVTFKAETELKDLIAWVMGFTCKNFMYDPRIVSTGRKISLIVPGKLSARDAYGVFLAALATMGLTVVPRGAVYRIIEAGTAKHEALRVSKSAPGDGEQFVRYVYQPSYLAVETLQQAWQAIKSDPGDVQTVGRLLVVADYATHVNEMLALAKLVDVPGGSDGIYTLPVLHADAAKLSEKLTSILSISATLAPTRPGAPGAAKLEVAAVPSKIVVDERTNTLIIAGSPAGYARVKALVERLDIALEIEGGSSIHVYPLSSAIAEELAKTLTAAIGDGRSQRAATGAPPGSNPSGPSGPSGAGGAAPTSSSPALDSLGTAIEGQVRVIADPPTNSLIVMSSGRDFFAIKDVIKQLDLARRQVYIEALILEVGATDNTAIGTSAHALDTVGNSAGVLLGGVETSDVNTIAIEQALASGGTGSGLLAGLIGKALKDSTSLLGTSIPSFAVLFRAVADQSSTHIVSSPSIIAVDNVEAKYKIGTTIPVPHASLTTSATLGGLPPGSTSTTVESKELPLTLDIKPHISNDDTVLLEVKHESLDKTADSALGPSWSTRSFETRVVVRDQQTVVLGGLTQEKETAKIIKVPVLGDIPLLGYLFKTTSKERSRTNLLVLLTPYIIKDQRELQAIQQRKLRQHEEFTRSSMALDHLKFEPEIDYGKKRGVIEEINRAVQDVDREAAVLTGLPRPRAVQAGSVDPSASEDRSGNP